MSTGAANDLGKVAGIVRNMLAVYGMSKQMPNRSLVEKRRNPFLDQEGPSTQRRSEKLEALVDRETQDIIDAGYPAARQLLVAHRRELQAMAQLLLEKEKIDAKDIQGILGADVRSDTVPAKGSTTLVEA